MNVDEDLREIIIDMFAEKLSNNGYTDEEIDACLLQSDSTTTMRKNLNELLEPDIIDKFYNCIFVYFDIKTGNNPEYDFLNYNDNITTYCISNFLIAYFIRNYVLYHYHDPNYQKRISTICNMDFGSLKCHYYEYPDTAMKYIKCLIGSLAKPQFVENNKKLMKENNEEFLIKFLDDKCKYITLSLNDLLRNLLLEHFNSNITKGYPVKDAVFSSLVWLYNDEDIHDTFKTMKLSQEEILKYKSYLRKIMIADVYEDAMNNPITYTMDPKDEKKEREATALAIYAISSNKQLHEFDQENMFMFVYHYINLLHDQIKLIDNRLASTKTKRLNLVKKFNPSFMFDEF